MHRGIILAACGLLLAGCAAAPAATPGPTPPAATAAPAATATPEQAAASAVKTQRLTVALNACIAFEADSAGGSLKTAVAAAGMVEYLAGDFVPDDLAGETTAWQAALSADDSATMDANWPGVYRCAQDICADPAAQQDLLDTAGVTTDFTAMDLTGVPAALDTIDAALGGTGSAATPQP